MPTQWDERMSCRRIASRPCKERKDGPPAGVQSLLNYVESGARAQAALIGCNASQGIVDSIP